MKYLNILAEPTNLPFCGHYTRRIVDTKISLNAEITFDFYLHSTDRVVPKDYVCKLTVFNGARLPSKFKNGTTLSPINIDSSEGWFKCATKKYRFFVPDNLTCELCTFEWSYKKLGSQSSNSICADTWANSIWYSDDNVSVPRPNMRFERRSQAQDLLDDIEGKSTFGDGAGEWIVMIASLVVGLVLTLTCCVFCGKRRVRFDFVKFD